MAVHYMQYRNWWSIGMKGLLILLIGLLALFFPAMTLVTLVVYIGVVLIVSGLFLVLSSILNSSTPRWYIWLIEGLIDAILGVVLVAFPEKCAIVIFILLGLYALAMGLLQILAYFRLRNQIKGTFTLMIGGVLSFMFGIAMLINPLLGGVAIAVIFGAFATMYGILTIIHAVRFSRIQQ